MVSTRWYLGCLRARGFGTRKSANDSGTFAFQEPRCFEAQEARSPGNWPLRGAVLLEPGQFLGSS